MGKALLKLAQKLNRQYIYLLVAFLWRYLHASNCVDKALLLDLVMPLADVGAFSCLIPPTSWDLQPLQPCQRNSTCEHCLIHFQWTSLLIQIAFSSSISNTGIKLNDFAREEWRMAVFVTWSSPSLRLWDWKKARGGRRQFNCLCCLENEQPKRKGEREAREWEKEQKRNMRCTDGKSSDMSLRKKDGALDRLCLS